MGVTDSRAAQMTEDWKHCEGRAVDEKLFLGQYLGGSDHSAVFLTKLGESEAQRAAIKLIPANPESAERQLSRWGAAAKVSHPHLIRLFQMGRCELANTSFLYVVMEYAEEDLSQILPQRPLTPAEAHDMLLPVLDVLSYLHGRGFVHGHLKPSNIMAVGDQLRLSSDGLCRIGESIRGSGKPSVYDPPEASSGAISPAGNVWSLGMTLVEVLTQQLPAWEGKEQDEPALPETLPQPFLDIASHCLRRDPYRRWTVADIKARLEQARPVLHPTSPSPTEQIAISSPPKLPSARPYLAPIAVGVALLGILAGSRLLKRRPELPPPPATAPARSGPAPSEPERSEPIRAETKPPAAGLSRGSVVDQVVPDVPGTARDSIQGTVRVTVRVAVDPSGNVSRATLDSSGPSKYFAGLALQASRRWRFTPPQVDGRNIPSEWILRFQFARDATKVAPAPATP